MFTQIGAILDKAKLSMSISKKGDIISASVLPILKEGSEHLTAIPFVVSGTAEELDKGFIEKLIKVFEQAAPSIDNTAEFVADAKKTQEKRAATKPNPSVPSTTTAAASSNKINIPKDKKDEVAAYKKIQKMYADAAKKNEEDMYNYFEKECIKEADKIKSAVGADVKKEIDDEFKGMRENIGKTVDPVVPAAGKDDLFNKDQVGDAGKEKTDTPEADSTEETSDNEDDDDANNEETGEEGGEDTSGTEAEDLEDIM